jgi:hypothetical protein
MLYDTGYCEKDGSNPNFSALYNALLDAKSKQLKESGQPIPKALQARKERAGASKEERIRVALDRYSQNPDVLIEEFCRGFAALIKAYMTEGEITVDAFIEKAPERQVAVRLLQEDEALRERCKSLCGEMIARTGALIREEATPDEFKGIIDFLTQLMAAYSLDVLIPLTEPIDIGGLLVQPKFVKD